MKLSIKKVLWFTLMLILVSCSVGQEQLAVDPNAATTTTGTGTSADVDAKIKALQDQILALSGTSDLITGLINSDFATCPNSGDTSDALIRKICQVSQAANVEQMIAIKEQLTSVNSALKEKLNAVNDDITAINASSSSVQSQITSIQSTITTLQGNITTLQGQMTSANSAISALQSLTASISTALAGTMSPLEIGTENVAAGPVYETVLRLADKSRINAYVESYTSTISLANNALTPTNGSATVTVAKPTATITVTIASPAVVTWTAHGFALRDPVIFSTTGALPTGLTAGTIYYVSNVVNANSFQLSTTQGGTSLNTSGTQSGTHTGSIGLAVNDLVHLSNLTGGSGFTAGDVTGDIRVVTVPSISSFTITLRKNATANTAFGGNIGTMYKVYGRGMGTIWVTANGADTVVRVTTLGTQAYNFAIKATGDICYDTALATQTFANIITSPVGTVVCK